MTVLYGRKIDLTISPKDSTKGISFNEFRVAFRVTQRTMQTPNVCDLRIYNLSDETTNKLKRGGEFSRVRLSAGYDGEFGLLFDGTIIQTRNGRENPTDTYFDVTATTGDQAYNYATVNTTLAAGATDKERVQACLKAMEQFGITLDKLPDGFETRSLRGTALFGMARDILRDIAEKNNCTWTIENNVLRFLPRNTATKDPAIEMTSTTGMIGLPVQTQLGIAVRSLLRPSIKIGTRVHINNRSVQRVRLDPSITNVAVPVDPAKPDGEQQAAFLPRITLDGFYRVCVVDHAGDTRGNDWYSELICIALGDQVTPSLLQQRGAS